MIILFPTGLYQDAGQLPEAPKDAGNVTFTISSTEPRRSESTVFQLPVAEELHQRGTPILTDAQRREVLGDLVYTIVDASRTIPGSGKKMFSVGQFLEFTDEDLVLPDMSGVPTKVSFQHNTNLLDFADAGLSQDEIDAIQSEAAATKKTLEAQMSSIQSQIGDKQVQITENQKNINEANKLADAVALLSNSVVAAKLSTRLTNLTTERVTLIAAINDLNDQATQTYNDLVKVSELVR